MTLREYNEARAKIKKLLAEQERLERREDYEDDDRLVEIQNELNPLIVACREFRAARNA